MMEIAILFVALLLRIDYTTAMPASSQRFQPPNLDFQSNLENLLDTFASQASKIGFYDSTYGEGADLARGLYLCRGDLNGQDCSDCVAYAKDNILGVTNSHTKKALFWYEHCMIRYSMANESFTDEILSMGILKYGNGSLNPVLFAQVLGNVLFDLAAEAANDASGMRFAAKVVRLTRHESLFAMGQCTWDLMPSDCNKCLTNAATELLSRNGHRASSGRELYSSCMVRYDTFPFFRNTNGLPSSSSTPSLAFTNIRDSSLTESDHEGAEVM